MGSNSISAEIFELAAHNSSYMLLAQLSIDQLKELIKISRDPSFGKEGEYRYFCGKCNSRWFFETEEELNLFKGFHQSFMCDYEPEIRMKDKKLRDGTIKKRSSIVQKKTGYVLSNIGLNYMQEILTTKELAKKNEEDKKAKADVPTESEV